MDIGFLTPGELAYEQLAYEQETQLTPILISDDTQKFLELLEERCPSRKLLLECMSAGATECTRVLILDKGVTPPRYWDNYSYAIDAFRDACNALCDPLIIDIFIEDFGYLPLVNHQLNGVLPIHDTLGQLSLSKHLKKWSVGQSIFKLLILLCLPETRPILECLEVLAQYTRGLEEIACYCVMDGGVRQLAALLLVARHKVLVPVSGAYEYCYKDERKDDGAFGVDISDMGKDKKRVHGLHLGLTIKQHVIYYLGLPSHELEKSFDEPYEEIEMSLKASHKMLQVFEKAGDAFDAYLQSDQSFNMPVEQVIISIGLLLKKAGFHLEYKDINLTDTHSLSEDEMEHICKKLEITRSAQREQEDQGTKEQKFTPTPTQIANSIIPLLGLDENTVEFIPPMDTRAVPHGVCFPAYGVLKYTLQPFEWVSCRFYSSSRLTSKFCSSWRLRSYSSSSFVTNSLESPVVNVSAQRQLVGNSSMRKIAQMVTCLKKKGIWRV